MHNSTLCYILRGDDVLMLHRVKKKLQLVKYFSLLEVEAPLYNY